MAEKILGEDPKLGGLALFMKDVVGLDKEFNLTALHEPTTENLAYFTLALAGECGEVCNALKKLLRDGESEERWNELEVELVDMIIYFLEVLNLTQTDFVKVWNEKHEVLYQRFLEKKAYGNGVSLENKLLQMRGRSA